MLRRMTEEEIAIRKISGLRMVSVYEFTDAVTRKDESDGETGGQAAKSGYGCTAITVFYGDREQLTKSELDPYYCELVSRAMELYAEAQNRDEIIMDADTRQLFESGMKEPSNGWTERFFQLTGTGYPNVPPAAGLEKMFLPMAEYLMTEIGGLFNREVVIRDRLVGWRGSGMILTSVGNKTFEHPVHVKILGDREYLLQVGAFPEETDILTANVTFSEDEVEISFATGHEGLSGKLAYRFTKEGMQYRADAYAGATPVCYDRADYETKASLSDLSEGERKLLPEADGETVIYQLPFGAAYVVGTAETRDGDIKRSDFFGTFLFRDAFRAETAAWTTVQNERSGVILKKDSYAATRMTIGSGEIQTYFLPDVIGASGRYRTELSGRYYYE